VADIIYFTCVFFKDIFQLLCTFVLIFGKVFDAMLRQVSFAF